MEELTITIKIKGDNDAQLWITKNGNNIGIERLKLTDLRQALNWFPKIRLSFERRYRQLV